MSPSSRLLVVYLPSFYLVLATPEIQPLPATCMTCVSSDIPPHSHTSLPTHVLCFCNCHLTIVSSRPTCQNCHYLWLHILPGHHQRQGVSNISQSLCSYTNGMQMYRLFPYVICIFPTKLYRTEHAAAKTSDLYNVFHMVPRLKWNRKQGFLINADVLLTFSDPHVVSSRGLTEVVLILICSNLLIWLEDAKVKNCYHTLWFNITQPGWHTSEFKPDSSMGWASSEVTKDTVALQASEHPAGLPPTAVPEKRLSFQVPKLLRSYFSNVKISSKS